MQILWAGACPKPPERLGARDSIQVSHMGSRNPIIWTIITALQDLHEQDAGVKHQTLWDAAEYLSMGYIFVTKFVNSFKSQFFLHLQDGMSLELGKLNMDSSSTGHSIQMKTYTKIYPVVRTVYKWQVIEWVTQ